MADFFRHISDFWNAIMNELGRVLYAFTDYGDLFGKLKDMIADLLGKTADLAESAEQEQE